MKPMQVAIKYFLEEIVKRTSKSFAKAELSKEEFDRVINNVEEVKSIVNNAKKEGNKNGRSEDNQKS